MGVTYTVQQGDTLSAIAQRAGLDWRQLLALNLDRVKNPNPNSTSGSYNVIFPGTVLRLVGAGSSDPAPAQQQAVTAANQSAINWTNANESKGSMWLWVALVLAGAFVIFSD